MPRILLTVLLAGLVIYALVWIVMWLRSRGGNDGGAPRTAGRPAPDDDPVFLAQIDRRLREQRAAERRGTAPAQPSDGAAAGEAPAAAPGQEPVAPAEESDAGNADPATPASEDDATDGGTDSRTP